MRILFIIHSLPIGGAETIVTEYLIKLKEKGHEVALLELHHTDSFLYDQLKENDIPVYTAYFGSGKTSFFQKLKDRIGRRLFTKRNIERLIRRLHPDVIHLHTTLSYMDRLDFDYKKIVYTFHTNVERTFRRARKGARKAFLNACKKGMSVVAISEAICNDTLKIMPSCDVVTIPNGIDVDTIRSTRIDREEFCRSVGIPVNAFVVGHVGRFDPVKNHEKVIDVFAKVHERAPNSVLLLIGNGETERVESIRRRVEKYGLPDVVYFLGTRSDAKSLMSILDCFLLPSYVEGFPLVLGEAQCFGVRSIATAAVPDEVIINNNCFKLDIAQSDDVWADYALGDFVRKAEGTIESIDINTVIDRHVDVYRRMTETCNVGGCDEE